MRGSVMFLSLFFRLLALFIGALAQAPGIYSRSKTGVFGAIAPFLPFITTSRLEICIHIYNVMVVLLTSYRGTWEYY